MSGIDALNKANSKADNSEIILSFINYTIKAKQNILFIESSENSNYAFINKVLEVSLHNVPFTIVDDHHDISIGRRELSEYISEMVFNNCKGIEGDIVIANKVKSYTLGELITRYARKQKIVIHDSSNINNLESLINCLLSDYYAKTRSNAISYVEVYSRVFNTFDLVVMLGSKDSIDVREIYYKHHKEFKCGLGYDSSESKYIIYSDTRIKFITDILHSLEQESDKDKFMKVVTKLTLS